MPWHCGDKALNQLFVRAHMCRYRHTCLHGAVKSMSMDTVRFLMENGAVLTRQDLVGDTALHEALACVRAEDCR